MSGLPVRKICLQAWSRRQFWIFIESGNCRTIGLLNNFEGSTFTGAETTSKTEPVCFFNCTNLGGGTNLVYSFHPGAGGVAMCDGSAHMLNDKIDIRAMLGMVTFNGHEPITDAAIGK